MMKNEKRDMIVCENCDAIFEATTEEQREAKEYQIDWTCSDCRTGIKPKMIRCDVCQKKFSVETDRQQEALESFMFWSCDDCNSKEKYLIARMDGCRSANWFTTRKSALKDQCFGRDTEVFLDKEYSTEEEAKVEAERARYRENNERGIEIFYTKEDDLWTIMIGGKVAAKGDNICLLCKHYRGCDYHAGSCGVLS